MLGNNLIEIIHDDRQEVVSARTGPLNALSPALLGRRYCLIAIHR